MPFSRQNYEYFFPSKVYRCACLGEVIDNCFDNGCYSFTEIYDEVSSFSLSNNITKVFSIKCGDFKKDALFVCENHLGIVLFAKKNIHVQNNRLKLILLLVILTVIVWTKKRHTVLVALDITYV